MSAAGEIHHPSTTPLWTTLLRGPTPNPQPTASAHDDWKRRLDKRIDRCPGCDEWRWDGHCTACDGPRPVPQANDANDGGRDAA